MSVKFCVGDDKDYQGKFKVGTCEHKDASQYQSTYTASCFCLHPSAHNQCYVKLES
ncbi:hypothetical protein VIN01S_11840 [Vibrio inusitatus NBRC 102082]|uniref:Uncharacterized protein n=1 Tax=Vibrio inusitatus NBRC 102082 TaxID=1219070 RepID=A0A4Y3HUE4_9VIBR|nr:hypothetical protein VIN01S_11840 [Vibrio inusitatus NBRC 102082]